MSNASRLDDEHFDSLMAKLEEWKKGRIISKYNQKLVEKVRNREIVIEVDGFKEIKDLVNYIYPDDPFLEDEYVLQRNYYFTGKNIWYNQSGSQYYKKTSWASEFVNNNEDMETKLRVKAIEFLVK